VLAGRNVPPGAVAVGVPAIVRKRKVVPKPAKKRGAKEGTPSGAHRLRAKEGA
jgi:serine acetyltransferase